MLEQAKQLYEFIKENLDNPEKCIMEIIKYFTKLLIATKGGQYENTRR